MVNVIPLFKRQTIKNLIIDDDLDMGGYDIKTTDLVASGIGSFGDDVTINGTTINEGDMNVNQDLSVAGLSTLQSGLVSNANSTINGDLTVTGNFTCPQLKTTYTISYTSNQNWAITIPAYSMNSDAVPSYLLLSLPPNHTISGNMRVQTGTSDTYMCFLDVKGNKIGNMSSCTTGNVITVPAGTNQIRVGRNSTSSFYMRFYQWVIV